MILIGVILCMCVFLWATLTWAFMAGSHRYCALDREKAKEIGFNLIISVLVQNKSARRANKSQALLMVDQQK